MKKKTVKISKIDDYTGIVISRDVIFTVDDKGQTSEILLQDRLGRKIVIDENKNISSLVPAPTKDGFYPPLNAAEFPLIEQAIRTLNPVYDDIKMEFCGGQGTILQFSSHHGLIMGLPALGEHEDAWWDAPQ